MKQKIATSLLVLCAACAHEDAKAPVVSMAPSPVPTATAALPTSVPTVGKPPPPPPAATNPLTLPPPRPTTIPLAVPSDDKVDTALTQGDAAFESGDITGALKHYQAALKAAPKRAAPIVGVARVRIAAVNAPMDFAAAKGNAEILAASKDLRRAASVDPSFGPAQVELGRALLLLGDAPGAIDSLRRGAQLLPNEPESHSALGVALLATGKGDEALGELARAADLDPGSAPRHGNLGTVLFMRGRVKDAIKEYEVQARLSDGEARAHSDLGTALLADNDISRAVKELERAIALDPKRATFHSNLGYALQIQGKRSEAVAEYRDALKLDDKLASAWINLATALARDPKSRVEARAALEKARAIDPTDPRVKANLEELDDLEKGKAP